MKLTTRFVNAVNAVNGKRATYPDSQVEGLELRVSETGTKTWSLRYRSQLGDRRRLTLGRYPVLSLADARADAVRALAKSFDGEDPSEQKKIAKQKQAAASKSLDALAAEYFASLRTTRKKAATIQYETWLWNKHIAPRTSGIHASSMKRRDVRALVRVIGTTAGPRTGNYAQALLRQLYNFALREEMLEHNPAVFEQVFQTTSRDRVLRHDELCNFWSTLSRARDGRGHGMSEPSAIALQLCLATLQRAGEVVGMHSDELDWATNSWIIPASRTKNRRAHHVPLSALARQLVLRALVLRTAAPDEVVVMKTVPKVIRDYSGPIFPALRSPEVASHRQMISRAMGRARRQIGLEDASPHDLRRTGASMLASEACSVPSEIIARILNHTPQGSPVTQIYNRYDYAAEKRAALETWSDLLLELN